MFIANPVYTEREGKRTLLLNGSILLTSTSQIVRLYGSGVTTVDIDTDKGIDTHHKLVNYRKWNDLELRSESSTTISAIAARHFETFSSGIRRCIAHNPMLRLIMIEDEIAGIFDDVVSFFEKNMDLLLAIIRLKSGNEFIFNHAVSTTILSISMAGYLKFSYSDITRIGIGAMVADIGMTSFPSRLTMRPSGITAREHEEIRKHPLYMVDFLRLNGVKDPLIETIVLQHHERYNGSGYPRGLKGDQIHPIAKLYAIADVYNAMTSPRPQRQGIPPHIVLADILRSSGQQFDPGMVMVFIKNFGVYPIGNLVELTKGFVALVSGRNREEPLRPPVIVFQTRRKPQAKTRSLLTVNEDDPGVVINRGSWQKINLMDDGENYGKIKRGLDHRVFHINPDYYLNQIGI